MPLWGWIAIGLGLACLIVLALAVWGYPRDGSF